MRYNSDRMSKDEQMFLIGDPLSRDFPTEIEIRTVRLLQEEAYHWLCD
jgi:hypothetical protein